MVIEGKQIWGGSRSRRGAQGREEDEGGGSPGRERERLPATLERSRARAKETVGRAREGNENEGGKLPLPSLPLLEAGSSVIQRVLYR